MSNEDHFDTFVINAGAKDVAGLRTGVVPCMHCPHYFRFTKQSDIKARIIAKFGLRKNTELHDAVEQLNQIIRKEVDWWVSEEQLKKLEKYWAVYLPVRTGYDGKLYAMFTDGTFIYVIANGRRQEDLVYKAIYEPNQSLQPDAAPPRG